MWVSWLVVAGFYCFWCLLVGTLGKKFCWLLFSVPYWDKVILLFVV